MINITKDIFQVCSEGFSFNVNNNIINIVEMKDVNNFKINRALLIVDEINSKLISAINFYIENNIKSFFICSNNDLLESKIDEIIEDYSIQFDNEYYLEITTIKEDDFKDAIFIFLQDINNYGELNICYTTNLIIYDKNIINIDDIYSEINSNL